MMRLFFVGVACCYAVAAAPTSMPTPTDLWIGSESESIGVFDSDDSTVSDNFNDLFSSMDEVLSDDSADFEEDFEVDPDGVGSDLDQDSLEDLQDIFFNYVSGLDVRSSYDTYYGSIGTTYLEYMRGFLPKLGFRDHYVASRTGQYSYIFAFGDLDFNGSSFSGDVTVITFNTYNNGSYSFSKDPNFFLNPGSYLVYTDLSSVYPSLADTAGFSSRQILILLTIMCLVWTMDHMYQVRKFRRVSRL